MLVALNLLPHPNTYWLSIAALNKLSLSICGHMKGGYVLIEACADPPHRFVLWAWTNLHNQAKYWAIAVLWNKITTKICKFPHLHKHKCNFTNVVHGYQTCSLLMPAVLRAASLASWIWTFHDIGNITKSVGTISSPSFVTSSNLTSQSSPISFSKSSVAETSVLLVRTDWGNTTGNEAFSRLSATVNNKCQV